MSIKGYITELKAIKEEQKALRSRLKQLGSAAKIAEENILKYLKEKDQLGVKHQGTAITINHTTSRTHKPKKVQDSDSKDLLASLGVENPELVLEQLLEIRRGAPLDKAKIAFKKIKE